MVSVFLINVHLLLMFGRLSRNQLVKTYLRIPFGLFYQDLGVSDGVITLPRSIKLGSWLLPYGSYDLSDAFSSSFKTKESR